MQRSYNKRCSFSSKQPARSFDAAIFDRTSAACPHISRLGWITVAVRLIVQGVIECTVTVIPVIPKTFACLAVILDAFSRKAVGWAFEDTLDASLAIAALDTALDARKPQPGSLIHHSDRGVQYASIAYRQRLADRDITVSMSRPGNPFDNAKAESFMKTLKTEEINGKAFADLSDARCRIDNFIADVYNKDRLHSALGYQSPLEFETAFAQNKAR